MRLQGQILLWRVLISGLKQNNCKDFGEPRLKEINHPRHSECVGLLCLRWWVALYTCTVQAQQAGASSIGAAAYMRCICNCRAASCWCQAFGKAVDSRGNTQLCPWAFLTGQTIRLHNAEKSRIIKDIWQLQCRHIDPGYPVRIGTWNLDPVGPYLELNFIC